MKKIMIFIICLCLLPFTLLIGTSTCRVDAAQPKINPITVRFVSEQVGPVESDNFDLGVQNIKYKGSLLLHSPHPAFGGLSGILVSQDKKQLLAITDLGFWMKMGLEYTPSGFLAGTSDKALLGQLLDENGHIFATKNLSDAEALSRAPDSGFYVAFEREHRILHYNNGGKFDLSGPSTALKYDAIKELPENKGIETMLLQPDKSLLVISEGGLKDHHKAFGDVIKGNSHTNFCYKLSSGFHPTAAANLPDNKILVLERRYHGPGTLGIRIKQFDRTKIKHGVEIDATDYFEIRPPLPRDNYEGLDSVQTDEGTTLLYIISDDNFAPFQRTILMLFEITNRH